MLNAIFYEDQQRHTCHYLFNRKKANKQKISVEVVKLSRNWIILKHYSDSKNNTTTDNRRLKEKESTCCNDSVKIQTSTWVKCSGGTLKELKKQ